MNKWELWQKLIYFYINKFLNNHTIKTIGKHNVADKPVSSIVK